MPAPDRFDRAGAAFAQLCRTVARLRAPGGCPWDAEQTLTSLKPFLIEEAYEVIAAIESGEAPALCEELGDLLLQVVFQADVVAGVGGFDVAAVVAGIEAKLRRRHPEVFAGAARDASAPGRRWEAAKAAERPAGQSVLAGVPRALPGLTRAARTAEKAAAVGFDFDGVDEAMAKLDEEVGELRAALRAGAAAATASELGDVIFAAVNVGRQVGVDPEEALRLTIDKFHRRFRHAEAAVAAAGERLGAVGRERLDALWDQAKAAERGGQVAP